MESLKRQRLLEYLIYSVILLTAFFTPVISGFHISHADGTANSIDWKAIFHTWNIISFFVAFFLIHNFFLFPNLLIKWRKYWLYAISTLSLIFIMSYIYPSLYSPIGDFAAGRPKWYGKPEHERTMEHDPRFDRPFKPNHFDGKSGDKPSERLLESNAPGHPEPVHIGRFTLMPPFTPPSISSFIILMLICVLNIAVKLLFKSVRDEAILRELERNNLQTELDYLKYQINPHFFMNTLNNIHALVDIDTEKAKSSIVELSKMMRYVLYEANQPKISLDKEIQFLKNYIELMRLRFTNRMRITTTFPYEAPAMQIPPLLFISFIENAFKHGVSYQKDSFVDVAMKTENGHITFNCINSNHGTSDGQHNGIGLENIKKRLQLLFKDRYTLSIISNSDKFDVTLIIPT